MKEEELKIELPKQEYDPITGEIILKENCEGCSA